MSLPGQLSSDAGVSILASILREIGAPECLPKFIEDDQIDDCIVPLGKMKPARIASKYGLTADQAAAFVEKCVERQRTHLDAVTSKESDANISAISETQSVDGNTAVLQKLNLKVISKLGGGGFGTVYKCKNINEKVFVAVKVVNSPEDAREAMQEGLRVRRIEHPNIVRVFRVHDLNPYLGDGSCAIEMEIVGGGDLYHHLKACRCRPDHCLPRQTVLRLTRQLLEVLKFLHDEKRWIHGDIKPNNLLLQCSPIPADGSPVDYSNVEIKLADFGLTKILDEQISTQSFVLQNANTEVGKVKGTRWYLSPEAFHVTSVGYQRSFQDDLWSACLVILEMDTGLELEKDLMTAPGSVRLEELLTRTSSELLPLLYSVLAMTHATSRCQSAADLLRMLDANMDPLFVWQRYDSTLCEFVAVPPASFLFLERAFSANEPLTMLPLQPPLDLNFDIKDLLTSASALGLQRQRSSGASCYIRRVLKSSVLTSIQSIPVWQELIDGKEWLQCAPFKCAMLDIDHKNPHASIDSSKFRPMMLQASTLDTVQLPHAMKNKPYLAPAHATDISIVSNRIHESLPEWDVTGMEQVVNAALASKYAGYRRRVASRCNGNPNERMMFHFAPAPVIPKIWQEGEGHDPRLSNWAEVGKGAYFSKHVMYGYAYSHMMWPEPPHYKVGPEPPIGQNMKVFATLVCLGSVADMGPGCETCPSAAWDKWKKELPVLPKPTRPPALELPSDTAKRQHILDLMQVDGVPRYDSVRSTEGDMGTHPASTNKTTSGEKMCDIMHPRLKARANEWSEQFVLFEPSASYPMFIVTLTKNRQSPMGIQELIDDRCNPNRIKTLGFSATHVKALGKTAREMRDAGWNIVDMKAAACDASVLLEGGFSESELKSAGFTASQMKDAGCTVQQLRARGYDLAELQGANFDIPSLHSGGYKLSELKVAGFSAGAFKAFNFTAQQLKAAGFTAAELRSAGFDLIALDKARFSVKELKQAGYSDTEISEVPSSVQVSCFFF
jgi:serine/threonine protein kinase